MDRRNPAHPRPPGAVARGIARLAGEGVPRRLWAKDPTPWADRPDTPEIADRLGWLTVYERRIKDRALVRFLEAHSEEIVVARLDKDFRLWLRSLGLRESEACQRRLPKTVLQSLKEHTCGRCGRKVKGNAIHVHIRACKRKGPAAAKGVETWTSVAAGCRG